ncbi:alpha/beta hydrolase [Spirosoma sp.]|uniref:alpha/beta hydrolase n=1 Tax=Spirosoma sp. TaxID=1899569 RepID=UPI003B3B9DAD
MNKPLMLAGLMGLFAQCSSPESTPTPQATSLPTAQARVAAQRYVSLVTSSVQKTLNVAYGKSLNDQGQYQTQHLDIYQPANDAFQARPVIVLIHGGGFTSGDKSQMANYANLYAQYGYVAVSINYRLSTKKMRESLTDPIFVATVDNAKEDAFGAIRWLRANAANLRIDKGRIAVMGYSAGGVTAMSVNFDQKNQRKTNSAAPTQSTAISTIVEMAGLTDPTLIGPGAKPLRMIHGVNDPGIKYEYAQQLYKVCQANRVPVVFQSTAGGHDLSPYFKEITSGTLSWFKTYLVDANPTY